MSGLYISYRRSDSPELSAMIAAQLAREYGDNRVFIDGEPSFARQSASGHRRNDIETLGARHLATACVVLVIVGPGWLAPDTAGRSRLFQPDDYVRLELTAALDRGVRIVPLFVAGAAHWPDRDALPDGLAGLRDHDGMRLRSEHFEIDLRGACALLGRPMREHAGGPTPDDLLHPALGFTPITLASGAALGAFEALKLQAGYEQVRQTLAGARTVSPSARLNRAVHDTLAPLVDNHRFQLAPDLSPALERAARQACRLKPYQPILAAVDLSLLRRGRCGLILTDAGLYHYGDGAEASLYRNSALAAGPIERVGGTFIRIGGRVIAVPPRIDVARVMGFVEAAARIARQAEPGSRAA